jgi:hypothetical protein
MYHATQQKILDRKDWDEHNLFVPGASRAFSSKTSSFGGTSAQSFGIALFFVRSID